MGDPGYFLPVITFSGPIREPASTDHVKLTVVVIILYFRIELLGEDPFT